MATETVPESNEVDGVLKESNEAEDEIDLECNTQPSTG